LQPKAKRTHVPALSPDSLKVTLDRLNSLQVSADVRHTIADILKAASNPDNEKIDVIIKTLAPERLKRVEKTAKQVRETTREITTRGRAGLLAMSDSEWDEMVRKANSE
jgi:hypothetical protein